MDILSEIVAGKRSNLEAAKRTVSLEHLGAMALAARVDAKAHALRAALSTDRINIIAEFKRRSPSKGMISQQADAVAITRSYESAGAAAISVLTEENYFAGSLDDLRAVREVVSIPILRKDFIFDEYQVYESAAARADALLLIVAMLDDETLARLLGLTRDLAMDALVEVHTREEMGRAVALGARLIGVNNRDLRTFEVSTETSVQLSQVASADAILVSESGLTPGEVRRLHTLGFRGFLVGEALMRAADPAGQIRAFRGEN